MMKYLIILTTWLISSLHLFGQHTLIHLDRPYYLPGQIIYYSISSSFADQDSCVLLLQCKSDQMQLDQHFIMLHHGEGHGYFQVPFAVPKGIYHISASVFTKKSVSCLELVVGSFSLLSGAKVQSEELPIVNDQSRLENAQFDIRLSEHEVKARKIVKCTIKVPKGLQNDKISVSVKDQGFYATQGIYLQDNRDLSKEELLRFLPIVGKRTLINENPKKEAFIYASDPKDMVFSFNWVDSNGAFFIKFPPFYGKRPFFFIDNGGNTIEVSLQDRWPSSSPRSALVDSKEAALGLSSFEERKKIYQLFSRLEETVSLAELPASILVKPDYNIDVQDFSVRGKLVDLLKEIITPLKFRKTKDDRYAAKFLYQVLDLKYFYDSEPLFFVNGLATRDFHFIASLPLQDIKSLKLYSALGTVRQLKLVDIGGVGVIEMVDPLFSIPQDLRLLSIEVQGLQNPVNYPIMVDVDSTLPLLRSLLYWQPDARLNAQGEYVFEIPCSDDITMFSIEVVHHRLPSLGESEFKVVF